LVFKRRNGIIKEVVARRATTSFITLIKRYGRKKSSEKDLDTILFAGGVSLCDCLWKADNRRNGRTYGR